MNKAVDRIDYQILQNYEIKFLWEGKMLKWRRIGYREESLYK
jgi:hypothetical protein